MKNLGASVPGTAAEAERQDVDLKTRVSWLYYMEGMTQDAVAERLGLSRLRVLKLLAACRQDGTVQIRITTSLSACVAQERALERTFQIDRAIVVPSPEDPERLAPLLGAAAGAFLGDTLRNGMRIGLGWGNTLRHSLLGAAGRGVQELTVVSLLGALTRAAGVNPSEFAWRFANMFDGACYMMAAPVFVGDDATYAGLLAHPGINEVFEMARRVDLALISVGDVSPDSTISRLKLISTAEMEELRRAGAVADVLCRFIDPQGRVIDHPLNRRVIALDPRELSQTSQVVLASGGWNKVTAMLAAIRLLRPKILITDEAAASGLLAA